MPLVASAMTLALSLLMAQATAGGPAPAAATSTAVPNAPGSARPPDPSSTEAPTAPISPPHRKTAAGVVPEPDGPFVPIGHADFGARVLQPHRGRVLVLNFWASWCQPCLEEMPALLALADKWRSRGVDFVFISADEVDGVVRARAALRKRRLHTPSYVVADADPGAFVHAIDPTWLGDVPFTVLYEKSGEQRARIAGTVEVSALEAALKDLVEQGP